jgi:HAD superfamily hydrolase (TIGR01450 family)
MSRSRPDPVRAEDTHASVLGSGAVLDSHDAVILDLDGVVYIGPEAVPGAVPAHARLRELGLPVCFLTNNASRPPEQIADHLRRIGLDVTEADVLTSAQVAASLLAEELPAGAPVLVIGGEGLQLALTGEGLTPVAGLDERPTAVVQGFHPDLTWQTLAEGTYAVRSGLPWTATNLDRTVPTPRGPAPGNGILVGVIEAATGRSPDHVAGKPGPEPFWKAAARMTSRSPVMVGDRLETDIHGARNAGIDAMTVLTGVTTARHLLRCPPEQRPHYLGRDLGDLFRPHPETTCVPAPHPGAVTFRGSCGTAAVQAAPDGLAVISTGTEALDLLRAACAAEWTRTDAVSGTGDLDGTHADARLAPVLLALQHLEPTATWAR